ncbi:MAG TPA: hypothetical protein ENJ74_03150 [Nitratifractor salsuginis]|uniref:Cytochrome c domain-containing protein n=1 Tax=Nitratifractor salsuginis TaxID=269261 RepID=A0A7V2WM07_9BACT|nr:hypothetical protein [Nitratifractor salsuginis]
MKKAVLILIMTLAGAFAADVEKGKALYLEAQCQKCHLQGENFDPNSVNKAGKVSKVKDVQGIHKWVQGCDNYFSIGWFPEEQDLVSRYLNAVFYHLEK